MTAKNIHTTERKWMAHHVIEDESVQQKILSWIEKNGVYEMTGFTESTGTVFRKTCFDGIVSKSKFYKFLRENPDFKAACEKAKTYWKQTLFHKDPGLREAYQEKLRKLGEVGFVRVKKRKTVKKDAAGEVIGVEEFVEEDVLPPPPWAVKMILGEMNTGKKIE